MIGGWIALQDLAGSGLDRPAGEGGGVAYLAHVGGAITGIVVALLFYDDARYIKNRNAAPRAGRSMRSRNDRRRKSCRPGSRHPFGR